LIEIKLGDSEVDAEHSAQALSPGRNIVADSEVDAEHSQPRLYRLAATLLRIQKLALGRDNVFYSILCDIVLHD
jgi:hypothetical protein